MAEVAESNCFDDPMKSCETLIYCIANISKLLVNFFLVKTDTSIFDSQMSKLLRTNPPLIMRFVQGRLYDKNYNYC
jgi:hypothetical protein